MPVGRTTSRAANANPINERNRIGVRMNSFTVGRSPLNGRNRQPIEVMTLDESETLLGANYDGLIGGASASLTASSIGAASRNLQQQPSVTIVDLGPGRPPTPPSTLMGFGGTGLNSSIASHKQRLPSISSVAIPSPFTEQTTITSTGE